MTENEFRERIAREKFRAYQCAIALLEDDVSDELKIQAAVGILTADVDDMVRAAEVGGLITN